MAGKKSASRGHKAKYAKYATNHIREKNKAQRIVANMKHAKDVPGTLKKFTTFYTANANHGVPLMVTTQVKSLLQKKNLI